MSAPLPAQAGAVRQVAWLLWPRWRGLRNGARSRDGRAGVRLFFLGVLGLAFMAGAFTGAQWLFERFLEVEFLAELLIRRVLDIVLLFFTGLLIFSNVITGFTTCFLSLDLPLLMAGPVPTGRLYLARLVDNWAQASWMMLVFALPILAGCGPVLGAGPAVYIALPLLVLPLTVMCAAVGTALTLALARWLPAQRTHDVLIVLAMLGFLVVYIAFRFAEPERFLRPEGFGDLVALVGDLRASENAGTPTGWVVDALFALLRGEWAAAAEPVALLYLGATAACVLAAWLARATWLRSFLIAQEGRVEGEGLLARLLGGWLGRRPARWTGTPVRALLDRDSRVFFRTTGQWTQLLLVAALVVVYLFNFKYFRTLEETGVIGPMGLLFVNLALSGLVVTTIAVRFLYPAVSLEGRAFWAVRVAPITAEHLLRAKMAWGLWPLQGLALALTVASDLIVGLPEWMIAVSVALSALMTVGLTGMGVGLGALWPRFHLDNPARIASGAGGVTYMLLALSYLVVMLVLTGFPLAALQYLIETGYAPSTGRQVRLTLMALGAIALTVAAWKLPLKLGAHALRHREE
ncbi:MAG: hypothetical protein KC620_00985 [Myxococcales bacterium]|nr:hypothetical protein [Myxococcales bacterium]